MKYLLPIFLLTLLSLSNAFAQKYTISGYVEDAQSGEKLIGANVYDARTLAGTTTNTYGFFSLTLPADSIDFTISFIGYKTYKDAFLLSENSTRNVPLSSDVLLDVVEVTATEAAEKIQERSQMSAISIPVKQIKSLPAFMGEVDVLKALQLLPGVQSGTEGASGIFVRGGSPDQNLILLDGVPVYNATHLFGFFSVFNADAINSVELIKGGFPARYGGRLSSVIDIRMKEGNMNEFKGSLSVGIVSSKLTLEGPIAKNKASFLVSARRTYIDLLMRPIIKSQSGDGSYGGYYFGDINGKVNYKFSDKDRIYLSAYAGDDSFYFRDKYKDNEGGEIDEEEFKGDLGWGNITAVARWNHLFSQKLFSNLTFTYSRYKLETVSEFEEKYSEGDEVITNRSLAKYFSGIRDWSGAMDFDFVPTPNHYIKFGASATHHKFKPGAQQFQYDIVDEINLDTLLQDSFVDAVELGAYIEDDVKIGQRLKANVGLHLSGFAVDGTFYKSIQPRLSARYLLNEKVSLKASYAHMRQFIHLLSSSSALNLPTDLWVPSTENVKPQQSHQVALGAAYTFKDDFEVSIEGYYKHMKGIIEYLEGASYLDGSADWQTKVDAGVGKAYGLEFFVQKKVGKTTGWMGYTLAWSNRQFERINLGEQFPYKYDRRHDFSIAVVHQINDRIELAANWIYGTGNAVTLALATYERALFPGGYNAFGYGEISYHGERNSFRMNSYHRFDFSATFTKEKRRGVRKWNIGVYNLYNRKNPFFILLGENYETNQPAYKQISIIPIVPSFSYSKSW